MNFDMFNIKDKIPFKEDIFKGKVVFITGGSGTICKKQAEYLVILGCNASIVGRNPEKTVRAALEISKIRKDSKIVACPNTDVRNIESLEAAVNKTVKELGKIDFVICGAAGNFIADFNHLSSNAFKSVVSIDLLGSFNTVKSCFQELKKNKGSIIMVSSTLHYYGVPFQIHVSAAKAGVDALSKSLAVELGPLGIRVNAIAPGTIAATEGFTRLARASPQELTTKIPLQRLGRVQDVALATVFLFSEAASYITGTVVVVDGGAWQTSNVQVTNSNVYPVQLKQKLLENNPKL
ncbi:hypothetical protein PACTADRAFT_50211 [Pachysolen tannophilus NRRL Y-2460]|uniref:2,4-dienoyl-CoA reductase [(3E)-enoyl-CoA-producing] n=1 Tax=Pachysolen tannophilus NRRL Y-2460 TaxID=669874 RepID=A0A1E4TUP1_PACTA|nr:hypothetical protein PACTADRAFT_50211 [Pachysolen tannophilus NRRL Y-2460]